MANHSFPRRLFAALLCMVTLLALLPASAIAKAASPKIVRVGLFEDIYHTYNDDGVLGGYGYEYLQKIAGYAGWTIEYVEADWASCFDKLESGEIDILNGISYTEERAQRMLFSSLPMAEERYFLYGDARDLKIDPANAASVDGKVVGVMKGSAPEDALGSWEAEQGISTSHADIETTEDVLSNLDAHAMDCFVSIEEAWDQDYIKPYFYIGSSDAYFAVNSGCEDIKSELDSAMSRIVADDPFYNDELYKKYFASPAAATLSDDERAWAEDHGAIRVGFIVGDVNIGEVDAATGEVSGVICDYIDYARDCLGEGTLDFEPRGFASMEDELAALAAGEIDMIFKVPYNDHYAAGYGLSLSDTTLNIPYSAVSLPGHFDQQDKVTVAITRDNWVKAWYVEYCYPSWEIVYYDSDDELERAVRDGQADCFLARTGRSRQYMKDSSLQVNLLDSDIAMSFGVRREDSTLLSILNKTILTMPAGLLDNALTTYDNETNGVTLTEFVRDNALQVGVVTGALLLAFSALVFAWRKTQADASVRRATDEAYQRELLAAKQAAEMANATKTDFLRRMSHDIRTPINGIRGMVEIGRHSMGDAAKLSDCADKIWVSTDHLLSLVNDVLDMNKLESGQFEAKREPFSLAQVIRNVHAIADAQARECGVDFIAQDPSGVEHDRLIGSPDYLERVFMNFVGNAIKYNRPGGSVRVYGKELSFDGRLALYEFVCEDTGIGMSEEFVQRAFEPFTQEEQAAARTKYSGTGLGLSISKSLVELLGGSVELTSRLGEGTRVVFRIPFEVDLDSVAEAEDEGADVSADRFDGVRTLLVEDNDLNAEIAKFLLENHGLVVDWVENGRLAVDALGKAPDAYDVVFMDVMMPVMDGLEAARRIRCELGWTGPIFAMTANAFADDAQRSRDAGMDEHLTKPLGEGDIVRALRRHVARS